jgi:hypothetical protein
LVTRAERDLLRPHQDAIAGAHRVARRQRQRERSDLQPVGIDALDREQVGLAEKVAHESGARMLVRGERAVLLLDAPGVHHHHAVGQRQRLGLVVRDHQRGDADRALDATQFDLHLLAQLGVEVRQRLV